MAALMAEDGAVASLAVLTELPAFVVSGVPTGVDVDAITLSVGVRWADSETEPATQLSAPASSTSAFS
jgi:hypothetical protein